MLEVTTNIDGLSYGDRRITRLLMGDIYPGSLVLLRGDSGTGKSVLCQQLVYNALYNNTCSVAYLTIYKKPDDLLDQMESFSFHVHYHYVSDKFRIYSLNLLNNKLSADESMELILRCLDNLPPQFTLVVIDNINPLLANMDAEAQITTFSDIKSLCKSKVRSVIMATNSYVFLKTNLSRVRSLCDYYLQTGIVTMPELELVDCRMMRSLEVRKIGGVEMARGEPLRFEIRAGTGIHILPYVTVRA